MPMLGAAAGEEENYSNGARDPIVGLWHVVYTAGGKVFNETLDQWHSDGTEFENAFLAPAQGNICFGVWKPTGSHSVSPAPHWLDLRPFQPHCNGKRNLYPGRREQGILRRQNLYRNIYLQNL